MSLSRAIGYPTQVLVTAFVLAVFFASTVSSAQEVYIPKNASEVDVFSTVLSAEMKANNWTKRDLICFSVSGTDPDKKLVKDLRRHGLNVRSIADWRKTFSCGFQVDLQIISLASPQVARIRADVTDLREINSGEGHFALIVRNGEYLVRKAEGKWSVAEYIPAK